MVEELSKWVVEVIEWVGYFGIFGFMFLESTFFPFPSEVVMIPAGYLIQQGKLNLWLAVGAGVLGSIGGAWFNYWLAYRFGRPLVLKIVSREKLAKLENFFEKYGGISTFIGRLIPGIRQYISLPAGLAKMALLPFLIYTALGSLIWTLFLAGLGYFIGENRPLLQKYIHYFDWVVMGVAGVAVVLLYFHHKRGTAEEK
jgi:membrane protein DedA with SNARE-associated domain